MPRPLAVRRRQGSHTTFGKWDEMMSQRCNSEASLMISELIYAVQFGDVDYVRKALAASSDYANITDSDGCSLLQWAAINNRTEIASMLIKHNAMVVDLLDTIRIK